MRRLFWVALGATIGAMVVRRLARAAEKLTPSGLAASLGAGLAGLSAGLRDFSLDVRAAMAQREEQLRSGTGLDGTLGPSAGPQP